MVFGNGWIGNKLCSYLNKFTGNRTILNRDRIDPESTHRIVKFLIREYNPDVVINCIGKTGRPNIDWCQLHKEQTFFSNVTVPATMAEICEEMDKYLVHLSSGCIFEGDNLGNGYGDNSIPNFKGSYYSKTKIFADDILSEYANVLKIRIRMPIDEIPNNRNLIDKLTGYKQVINVKNSVTCIPDLVEVTKRLIDKRIVGTVNAVNNGPITHKEILEMYKEIVDPTYRMPEFIDMNQLLMMTIARRSNCVLKCERLNDLGLGLRNTKDAITDCLTKYKTWKMKMGKYE